MSANVEREAIWSWWCDECAEGDGPFDSESWADQTADAHDDEHHPEADA